MDDGMLIEQVSLFPQLYVKSYPRFKNVRLKENAWKTIAVVLEETPEACEHRWKVLRNKYTALKRQVNNPPSGSAAYEITWPYYEGMKLLEPYLLTRQSYSNLNLKRKPKSMEWDSMSTIVDDNFSEGGNKENSPERSIEDDRASTSHQVQAPSKKAVIGERTLATNMPRQTIPQKKKQKTDDLADKITGCFESFQKVLDNNNQPSTPMANSGDEHFVRSLVEDLKVFSQREKILIKREIYNIVGNHLDSVDDSE